MRPDIKDADAVWALEQIVRKLLAETRGNPDDYMDAGPWELVAYVTGLVGGVTLTSVPDDGTLGGTRRCNRAALEAWLAL